MALTVLRTKSLKSCHLYVVLVLFLTAVLMWHRALRDGTVNYWVPVRRDSGT